MGLYLNQSPHVSLVQDMLSFTVIEATVQSVDQFSFDHIKHISIDAGAVYGEVSKSSAR